MTQKGVYEKLFKLLNKQLEKHKIIVKTGAIVDASIIDTPLKPKGRPIYQVLQDREEAPSEVKMNATTLQKSPCSGVDTQAAWIKKAGQIRYGYKKHIVTDTEGMVLGLLTTAANVNEISNLEEVLATADLPQGIPLKADKGYQSEKNVGLLKRKNLKNHILKKAYRNNPLSAWELKFNKLISKTRFKIERTFGGMKRWFHATCARYRGIAKMHTQNLLEAMAYNLYRSPGILMSNPEK
jgi:IS5 family transposase